MAQKLIVEGHDGIVLATLCKVCGLGAPVGYETAQKFKDEFVANAGGYDKAIDLLGLAIQKTEHTHIGIIVDANEAGFEARWQAIRSVLSTVYDAETLAEADRQPSSKIIREQNLASIGIWIMPDNHSNGYLEHFLAQLVPADAELWAYAKNALDDLMTKSFNELSSNKMDKALLHTWLAWKKDPGKPFGQALNARYFDKNAPAVAPFLDWFKATFSLNNP